MIPELIQLWEDKKDNIKNIFERISIEDINNYEKLINLIFASLQPTDEDSHFYIDGIRVLKMGGLSGDILFKVPYRYFALFIYGDISYGSCSVCDSLQDAIEDGREKNIDKLMLLSLHIIQCSKVFPDNIDFRPKYDHILDFFNNKYRSID